MTVIFQDSFDMYNGIAAGTGLPVRWTTANIVTWGTTTGRFSGSNALTFNGNAAGAGTIQTPGPQDAAVWAVFDGTSATTSGAIGFAFQINSSRQDAIIDIQTAAAVQKFSVGVSATGALIVCTSAGGTVFTSSAGLVTTGTWYYMEIEWTSNASTGTINLYLGGTSLYTGTGLNTGATGAGVVQFRMFGGGSSGIVHLTDDLYITNSAAKLGESRIETLRAASDNTKVWTPKTGSANYAMVNETLVDGDTTYVSTSTIGAKDLYTIAGLSSTPVSIFAANVVSFAEKTDASARSLYNSVTSGATVSDGTSQPLLTSYARYDRIMNVDPNTLAAWGASGVNNLLIGPKAA